MNFDAMVDQYFIQLEDELLGEDWLESFALEILDAGYEFTEIREVVEKLDHLTQQ